MTRLYLVRHGQTEWNRQERFRGRIDIPSQRSWTVSSPGRRHISERQIHRGSLQQPA